MTAGGSSGAPLAALRRLTRSRPPPPAGERCEMCAVPIPDEHSHVVNLDSRGLMCTCRGCYLLFTDESAQLRYRAVPERYLSFDEFTLDARAWDDLQIPVGLAFLFRNSVQDRTIAFYPSPAGATESELPLEAWERIVDTNPALATLRPDVEALLVRRIDGPNGSCHLVPIDACYELVGKLRMLWRGFDGGQQAHEAMDEFFADVAKRSRPAEAVCGP
ncbi:MAG: hypothetical protein QOG01_3614 [Pseudonocardiales bacterium]|nr:hypothetical protein [Pseudonocardiales bacterium]